MFFHFSSEKNITRYRRIGCNLNVMRHSACLFFFNQIMLDNYAAFFNCTRQTLSWPRHKTIHFSWLGLELFVCCLAHRGSTGVQSFGTQ